MVCAEGDVRDGSYAGSSAMFSGTGSGIAGEGMAEERTWWRDGKFDMVTVVEQLGDYTA